MAQPRITRDDLEAKFKAAQDGWQGKIEDKKQTIVTLVTVGGVVLLIIFFLLGKRSGKQKTTFVEIRRL
ncbi:MAG: hypothetical protein Q7V57_06660 [Actinomycetota bacterium]|nr:hypothetical protein [Actinomycetota bacterium]